MSKTPFRVSFFGGGTDYPDWYLKHGGAVIGTTINKYCYISIRALPPFFEHKHRIVYSKVELVSNIDEIQHPSVRSVLSELKETKGIEIQHQADLPARSGLGSSSSFTVGLLNAIRAKQGLISSAQLLSNEAIRIEQQVIKENVGSQDQVWAAHGGANFIEFNQSGDINVIPLIMKRDTVELINSHIMLFFTGISRIASDIAGKKIENLDSRYQQLNTISEMTYQAKDILQTAHCEMSDIGAMLHKSWLLKKQLASEVSTSEVDEIYEQAISAGAYGGKLLGAGGGGFIMFIAPPDKHKQIKKKLDKLINVQVKINSGGSKIVMYEPNGF